MKHRLFFLGFAACLMSVSMAKAAESIDIPEEELARESVLPKFDRPDNVRNRNVVTEKKIEVGAYYGANFTEPIYNQSKIGLNVGYHWSEDKDLMFNFAKWNSGRNTQYVPSIEDKGRLSFNRIPDIEYSLWANYEIKTYYGKISLTKHSVMNLSLYPIMGLGMTKYSNKTYPGLNGGIGQKFYFTNSLALRVDFKLQYQQGPNPFLKTKLLTNPASNPDPAQPADFEDKFALGTILDIGLSYMF